MVYISYTHGTAFTNSSVHDDKNDYTVLTDAASSEYRTDDLL